MEFINGDRPKLVEIHVKMTVSELEQILADMQNDCTQRNPYVATEEFMTYLKEL